MTKHYKYFGGSLITRHDLGTVKGRLLFKFDMWKLFMKIKFPKLISWEYKIKQILYPIKFEKDGKIYQYDLFRRKKEIGIWSGDKKGTIAAFD